MQKLSSEQEKNQTSLECGFKLVITSNPEQTHHLEQHLLKVEIMFVYISCEGESKQKFLVCC